MSFLKIFSLNGRTTNIIFILTYVLAYVLKIPVIIAAQYLPYTFMSDFLTSISKILAIYIVFAAAARRLNDINLPRFNAIFLCLPFALRHFVDFKDFAEFGMFALEIFAVLFLTVKSSYSSPVPIPHDAEYGPISDAMLNHIDEITDQNLLSSGKVISKFK